MRTVRAAALGLALAVGGCQLFVDSTTKTGIGGDCGRDADCQGDGATCDDGLCVTPCAEAADCPAPTFCTARKKCELPLKVGLVVPQAPDVDQWSASHLKGFTGAATLVPYAVLSTYAGADVVSAPALDKAIADGNQLVLVASQTLGPIVGNKANGRQDLDFAVAFGVESRDNVGIYRARMYKAYWLAGIAAAKKSTTKRLGFVGSYVTPAVVALVNAFHLGAQSFDPNTPITTELVWVGDWHDTGPGAIKKEVTLTEDLVGRGADVIAHAVDNDLPLKTASKLLTPMMNPVFTIGAHVQAGCELATRCIGAAVWNWAPVYRTIIDDVHHGPWSGYQVVDLDIESDPATSPVAFAVNDKTLAADVGTKLQALLADGGLPFAGPYAVNDMVHADVGMGEGLGDDEIQSMCWLVEGVVTFDGTADVAALVPPEGGCVPMN